ncbi:hypothetical protein WOLCODRAFT_143165 [Wolfiporia cocos MD-104 SS10]|uniref:Uncharacterized protein n=1 Tax=Wolfiporia cocos (strain MD-104) TaxID=742152 RepID=A0A2H3JL71_WOLCO|nr:hypothetical protein WOLCODRAFT_143165 [Wolfiporia cocos MD-104 SS10]
MWSQVLVHYNVTAPTAAGLSFTEQRLRVRDRLSVCEKHFGVLRMGTLLIDYDSRIGSHEVIGNQSERFELIRMRVRELGIVFTKTAGVQLLQERRARDRLSQEMDQTSSAIVLFNGWRPHRKKRPLLAKADTTARIPVPGHRLPRGSARHTRSRRRRSRVRYSHSLFETVAQHERWQKRASIECAGHILQGRGEKRRDGLADAEHSVDWGSHSLIEQLNFCVSSCRSLCENRRSIIGQQPPAALKIGTVASQMASLTPLAYRLDPVTRAQAPSSGAPAVARRGSIAPGQLQITEIAPVRSTCMQRGADLGRGREPGPIWRRTLEAGCARRARKMWPTIRAGPVDVLSDSVVRVETEGKLGRCAARGTRRCAAGRRFLRKG